MAEALKRNSFLQTFVLDVSRTQVGNDTGVAMAEALTRNSFLQTFKLDVESHQFGNEARIAMAEALQFNTTLRSFDGGLVPGSTGIQIALRRWVYNWLPVQLVACTTGCLCLAGLPV